MRVRIVKFPTLLLMLFSVGVLSSPFNSSKSATQTEYDSNSKSLSTVPSTDNRIDYTAHLNSANSSYAQLCRNQQFNNTGRPTTPPYTRLVNTVHQKLEQILNTDSKQWPEQLINLENEVLELNNDLLPGRILEELCFLLTLIAAADNTENSDALLKTKVVEFRNSTNEILDNYDYTAHRLRKSDEQRLLSELMTNYERDVRPVLKASEPVELKIGLTLNQIDVDEKNQVLTVLVWLDQEWIDEKLIWDPANYSGLTVLRIPCSLTWLPDIVLYNSVEDLREGYMQALTMVEHNGNVFWPPIVKYRGNCEIKIKYFPYDDQECRLKLGSWAYDGFQVNLTKRKDGIDLSNYQKNGEWSLKRTEVVRNVEVYPCCPEPYIDITFIIHLQRRTLYYVYNIIIPCIMLSILTLLSFWMKPDSGEKISLGLTILLAFSVFMLLIAESMPSTSFHVPIIGIYITSSMCLTAFSVISAVFIANVNHRAEGDTVVPYWIHKLCYKLGQLMCVKMVTWEERHCNVRQLAMMALGPKASNRKGDKKYSDTQKTCNGKAKSGADEGAEAKEEDPLLKRLHTIVEHQEELLQKQHTSDDWHAVATILDRCLFWIYLLMMTSTTIGCIFIFPITKKTIPEEADLDNC